MERKPSRQIFVVPAVLLEAECAVLAPEDIDTMVAYGTTERRYDSSGQGDYSARYLTF
jgi:hypothetical protein